MKKDNKQLLYALEIAGGCALVVLTIVCTALPKFTPIEGPLAILASVLLVARLIFGIRIRREMREQGDRYRLLDSFSQMPNEVMLHERFGEMKDHTKDAFVFIRLNSYYRLISLFGVTLSNALILKLCSRIKDFGVKHNGLAYRLATNRFGLLVEAADQARFLNELDELFAGMESLVIEDRHVSYSCHYTFHYGVYFLSESDEQMQTLDQIMEVTESAVSRLEETEETAGTVFNQQNKPDWTLQNELRQHVHKAWADREFAPYYQIVYNIRTNRPAGAELLTRWEYPGKGTVMPNDFLPIMETEGLIMDLDLYMLEEACKKIKGWIDDELVTVPLSVNIAKLNIHRTDFVERVIETIKAYDIPPVLLELEMTESILIYEKTPEFLELMEKLHKFGLTLSMDNFALNDFSSVNLMRDLPLDVLKVSNRFFANMENSERDRIFVEAVLDMAKKMRLKIVVMGVETEEQAQFYRSLGCEFAQGFFYSKPISNSEFEKQIF